MKALFALVLGFAATFIGSSYGSGYLAFSTSPNSRTGVGPQVRTGVGPQVIVEDQEVAREEAPISGIWGIIRSQKTVYNP